MKRILSFLLAVSMILCSFTFVYAEGEEDTFPDGAIQIASADELKAAANAINADPNRGEGKYYVLTQDINLNGEQWQTYIGSATSPFKGTFDGNGHYITNYSITYANTEGAFGLFGAAGGSAKIFNLGIKNVSIELTNQYSWSTDSGGLVGDLLDSATVESCLAKNVKITLGFVKNNDNGQMSAAGGLIGRVNGSGAVVKNCYAIGTQVNQAEVNYDGGLVGGAAAFTTFASCYSDTTLGRFYNSTAAKATALYYIAEPPWPWTSDSKDKYAGERIGEEQMKGIASALGDGFSVDSVVAPMNNGYPILSWEADIPTMEGAGTEENPFLIKNVENLGQVSAYGDTTGVYFKMEEDIDLEGAVWTTSIGTQANPFRGVFDGNGHIIKNFKLAAPQNGKNTYLGLFAYVGGDAVIKNVGVKDVTAGPGGSWGYGATCGGLAGLVNGNAQIVSCYAKNVKFVNEENLKNFNFLMAGGLIGKVDSNSASVINCYSLDTTIENDSAASYNGLVGLLARFSKMKSCYSNTTLSMCADNNVSKVVGSFCESKPYGSSYTTVGTLVTSDAMKGKAKELGAGYGADSMASPMNGGYPVLVWEGDFAVIDGTGTKDDPYLIKSPETLAQAASYNDVEEYRYFKLTCDIDLKNTAWESAIGTSEAPFNGEFDGDNHAIKNFTVDSNGEHAGIFAYVGQNSYIHNLGVEKAVFSMNSKYGYDAMIGGIVGELRDNARINECYAKNIRLRIGYDGGYAQGSGCIRGGAGIAGYANGDGVVVENCYAIGITMDEAEVDYDAGVVGRVDKISAIRNCYSDFTLSRCLNQTCGKVENSYYIASPPWPFACNDKGNNTNCYAGEKITVEALKTKAADLGASFKDGGFVSSGYPAFTWQTVSNELKGTGSEEDPYLIDGPDALGAVAAQNDTTGKYYRLENDIDLDHNEWATYIGTETAPFGGDFDGNGHVIKNYTVTNGGLNAGIFAYAGGDAYIHNLGVENASFTMTNKNAYQTKMGGIVGELLGSARVNECYSRNISFKLGYDTSGGIAGPIRAAAGIAGYANGDGVVVENCYSVGTILDQAEVDYDAGLVGRVDTMTAIRNCYSNTTLVRCMANNCAKVTNSYYVASPPWPFACTSPGNHTGEFYGCYSGDRITADALKDKAADLGSSFQAGDLTNQGYPMLVWQQVSKPEFEKGVGTAEDPYQIETVTQLFAMSMLSSTEGLYFKLMNDIDMGGVAWTSYIGTKSNPFKGDFNGNGHVVRNFTLNITGDEVYGLFSYIGGNAHVHHLGIESVKAILSNNVSWKSHCGALAGDLIDNAAVTACYVNNIEYSATFAREGGQGEIECGGGMFGYVNGEGVEIRDCYSKKFIETYTKSPIVNNEGGLFGMADNFAQVESCLADTYIGRYKNWLTLVNSYHAGSPTEWPSGYDYGYRQTDLSKLGYGFDRHYVPAGNMPNLKWVQSSGNYVNLVVDGSMNLNSAAVSGKDSGRNSLVKKVNANAADTFRVSLTKDRYYRISFAARTVSDSANNSALTFKLGDQDLTEKLENKTVQNKWENKVVYAKAAADGDVTLTIGAGADIYLDDVEVLAVDKEFEKTALTGQIQSKQFVDVVDRLDPFSAIDDGLEVHRKSTYDCFDQDGTLIYDNIPVGYDVQPITITSTIEFADDKIEKTYDLKVREKNPFDIQNLGLVDAEGNRVYGMENAAKVGTVTVKKNAIEDGKLVVALYKNDVLTAVSYFDIDGSDILVDMDVNGADTLKLYALANGSLKPMSQVKQSYQNDESNHKTTIHTIGDSLCQTYDASSEIKGWGQMIGAKFNAENVTIDNSLARSGMTAKEFVEDGRFETLMGKIKSGDYVFIQLGTNDSWFEAEGLISGLSREYFNYLMGQMVNAIREKGATAVIVTPPERLSAATDEKLGDGTYKVNSYLYGYPDDLRDFAKAKDIPVIDLNRYSLDLLKEKGFTATKAMNIFVADQLHFNDDGANWIADFVAGQVKAIGLPIGVFVKAN